jgi:hypothetical protein
MLKNWIFTISHGSLVESSILHETEPQSLVFFFASDALVIRMYVRPSEAPSYVCSENSEF